MSDWGFSWDSSAGGSSSAGGNKSSGSGGSDFGFGFGDSSSTGSSSSSSSSSGSSSSGGDAGGSKNPFVSMNTKWSDLPPEYKKKFLTIEKYIRDQQARSETTAKSLNNRGSVRRMGDADPFQATIQQLLHKLTLLGSSIAQTRQAVQTHLEKDVKQALQDADDGERALAHLTSPNAHLLVNAGSNAAGGQFFLPSEYHWRLESVFRERMRRISAQIAEIDEYLSACMGSEAGVSSVGLSGATAGVGMGGGRAGAGAGMGTIGGGSSIHAHAQSHSLPHQLLHASHQSHHPHLGGYLVHSGHPSAGGLGVVGNLGTAGVGLGRNVDQMVVRGGGGSGGAGSRPGMPIAGGHQMVGVPGRSAEVAASHSLQEICRAHHDALITVTLRVSRLHERMDELRGLYRQLFGTRHRDLNSRPGSAAVIDPQQIFEEDRWKQRQQLRNDRLLEDQGAGSAKMTSEAAAYAAAYAAMAAAAQLGDKADETGTGQDAGATGPSTTTASSSSTSSSSSTTSDWGFGSSSSTSSGGSSSSSDWNIGFGSSSGSGGGGGKNDQSGAKGGSSGSSAASNDWGFGGSSSGSSGDTGGFKW